MKLDVIKRLLDNNKIEYRISGVERQGIFRLMTILNPNHEKHIELTFNSADDNPDFVDMEFGGYWYEFFDFKEEYISSQLLKEIKNIMDGRTYIIMAWNEKSGAWLGDACFLDSNDEDESSMDEFRKSLKKIREPKSWLQKITKRTTRYEIFNWNSYESVVK